MSGLARRAAQGTVRRHGEAGTGGHRRVRRWRRAPLGALGGSFGVFALGNLAGKAVLFAVNAYLARVLDPAGYGQVVFAQTILLFGAVAADCGVRTLLVRGIAAGDREHLGAAWGGLLALSGLGMALLAAVAATQDGTQALLLLGFGLTLLVDALRLDWLLKGLRRFRHVATAEVLRTVVYLALLVVMARDAGDILAVPLAYGAGSLAAAAYAYLVCRRGGMTPRPRLAVGRTLALARDGLPLGLTGILTQFYMNAGILALAAFAGPAATGTYGAAIKLTLVVTMLGATFSETLLPILAREYALGRERGRALAVRVFALLALAGLSAAAVFGLGGEAILRLVYGEQYAGAGAVLAVLGVSVLPVFCNITLLNLLIVRGQQRWVLASAVAGSVVALGMSLTVTRARGPLGAALTELAVETAVVLVLAAAVAWAPRPVPRPVPVT